MKKEKQKFLNLLAGIAGFLILFETFVSMYLIEFFSIKWAWIPLIATMIILGVFYIWRIISGKEDYYEE